MKRLLLACLLWTMALVSLGPSHAAFQNPKEPAVDEKRSLNELIELMKSKDMTVRTQGILGLSALGQAAVPALIEALKDKEMWVRAGAASTLSRIGPAAKDAAPALGTALKDTDHRVRW